MKTAPTFGGVFALDFPLRQPEDSVLKRWGVQSDNAFMLHNARSILAEIVQTVKVSRVWFPAYICSDFVEGAANTQVDFYPVGEKLEADIDWLSNRLAPGDLVVVIAYFGRAANADILELASMRSDVLWIEDRAQAFDCGPRWADWTIYSPRKLVGVPDGGIGVKLTGSAEQPASDKVCSVASHLPGMARYEDIESANNNWWFPLFRQAEGEMKVSNRAISRLTHAILSATDSSEIAYRRFANYSILAARLNEFGILPHDMKDVPFGYPIRLRDCDRVWARLIAKRVFAPRHWADLPSPADNFAIEHALSRQLITLPCDQRYSPDEMHILADLVLQAVS